MLFGLFTRKNIRQLDDLQLVQLVLNKDNQATGELFTRYSPLVFGLCLKYMKNTQAAEDIMMNIFEKLPEKLQKSEISNFKNWLYSVSRNECLMDLRKKNPEGGDFETAALFAINEDDIKLNQMLQKEQQLESLDLAIKELKDEQKICVELFYLEKMSYEQIVAQTKYPLKKVKSYIQNGKRNLKLILEQQSEFK
ncbi:sigma-70 family RNA polymerase sigma factor [Paracrocinitomix mangrovi]|uniref:RNA polymerase sigma factor n=1 Tax=Paracrocinitomix mangrovi TaxID=2862509 RepID=UPI001C8E072E|nr:sigma-70 family RNA polymerase sigma factor [Paracrocinitomix mangrovi]UKN03043.1 sigma-70 family RNA polymerase sigma factor [Paracrocinitomix mangrovi]